MMMFLEWALFMVLAYAVIRLCIRGWKWAEITETEHEIEEIESQYNRVSGQLDKKAKAKEKRGTIDEFKKP
jgi:glutathionylspermidine synthase